MLEKYLLPQVEELQSAMMFQKDEAAPHWSNDIWKILNTGSHFPGRKLDRDGIVAWAPHSLDIIPLNYFL